MDEKELLRKILEIPEENQTIEFKRLNSKNQVEKIIETIVAMSNTDGGNIVIGIDDPEKTLLKGVDRIYGIEENPDAYDAVGREIQKIIPPIAGIWPPALLKSNDKTVAVIDIPKATQGFYEYNKHVFIRSRKSNRQLSPQEILNFHTLKVSAKQTESWLRLISLYCRALLTKNGKALEKLLTKILSQC